MLDILNTSNEAALAIEEEITRIFKECFRPPPKLNLVEWADKYRKLPKNSAEPGDWHTDRVPPVRQPMLSVSDPDVQEVTIMSCIQLMKHLAVDTPIMTTRGFKPIGNVRVGDKVFGSDGKPCNVIGVSPVTKDEPCYTITFSDGSKVTCSESHNWVVDDSKNRSHTVEYGVTKPTGEIYKTFKNDHGNRYAIPVTKPLFLPAKELPLDPYVLGVWLGDGHSYSTRFTSHVDDFEIVEVMKSKGFVITPKKVSSSSSENTREYHFSNGLKLHGILSNLGLMKGGNKNQVGNEKQIPDVYFTASFEQRLELLQGLMDTDGTICKKGNLSFCTSSPLLKGDFLKLAWSLGLKPRSRKLKTSGKDSYQITFTSYSELPVFKLSRKLDRMKSASQHGNRVSETKRRRIVDVEKIENVPVCCIAVDSADHLYLCGYELIPTHNTEIMLNTAMYYMHQEPAPIMYVAPNEKMAKAWSRERLTNSVNVTPVLKGIFSANRRDMSNEVLQKQFPGGQISIVSARNPGDLAMRACMVMLFDEVDKYLDNVGAGEGGSGGEGDAIAVAWGRATTYGRRAKKIVACSPTVQGKSRVESEYLSSNQSVYYQKCPHCDHAKELTWDDVVIPPDEESGEMRPDLSYILCSECGAHWSEGDRLVSIDNGYWVAKRPEVKRHHGYKVSSLASSLGITLEGLATEFVKALGNNQLLKAFYNTRMARTWREVGEQPDWERIYERREHYSIGVIPNSALMVTVGMDVQQEGVYWEVKGWGRRKENWSIESGYFQGDIEEDTFREQIKTFWDRTYKNEVGMVIHPEKIAIDSGYKTQAVYSLVREYGDPRVIAVKGEKEKNLNTIVGTPTPVDVNIDGKRISRGMMVWKVGSSVAKEQFYAWLNLKKPTDEKLKAGKLYPSGYCHFPEYDEEYFKQITAEQKVEVENKKGFTTYQWERTRKDNHFLDCHVYNRAAAAVLQIDRMTDEDWDEREAIYVPKVDSKESIDDTETLGTPSETYTKPKKRWMRR